MNYLGVKERSNETPNSTIEEEESCCGNDMDIEPTCIGVLIASPADKGMNSHGNQHSGRWVVV